MTVFTDEQQVYIQSSINEHVYLEACPGSGKTEVVAAKVAREAGDWGKYPGGMAILSFANSSTEELKERISKYLPSISILFPHFLGTFDSFIYKNIVSPISQNLTEYSGDCGDYTMKIIDKSSKLPYWAKVNIKEKGFVPAHHYYFSSKTKKFIFDSGVRSLDLLRNSEVIPQGSDAFDTLVKAKKRILKAGYAIYRDVEYLAVKATKQKINDSFFSLLAKRYPLIIVDECQDLSFEQLIILKKLSDSGVALHFIGDLHQSIYGFRFVEPDAVKEFTVDNDFINLKLTRNFRSCQKIINVCGKLTGRNDVVGQLTQLEPACYLAQYEKSPTELVTIFEELSADYNNAVIVARGHPTLKKFQTISTDLKPIHKLALAIRLFNRDDMGAIEESLTLYSEFIRHHITESIRPNSFNCPQVIESSLTWRKFLFLSLDYINDESLRSMDVSWSVWAKRAKENVRSLPAQIFVLEEIQPVIESMKAINLSAPPKQGAALVSDSLGQSMRIDTGRRKTTIHGAKGETHDVTMLVSSVSASGQQGSHWKSWLKNEDSEAARFAYVASSRPKHRLIWGVKKLKPVERKQFEELGFHII